MTKPEVFIMESLTFENEDENLYEGKILSQILHLSGKSSMYYYIRTKKELEEILNLFNKSKYRYLHISCHGDSDSMYTTLDNIQFDELAYLLIPCLHNKRLYLSACQMTNIELAKKIIPASGCYSIIGPNNDIYFNDAKIFWSSFYHLIFKNNRDIMKRRDISKIIRRISDLYNVPLNYFTQPRGSLDDVKLKKFAPYGHQQ